MIIPQHQEDGYDSSIPNVDSIKPDFDAEETNESSQIIYPIPLNELSDVANNQEKKV